MPRFLVRKECLAQVIFEYIVDAESDDEAVEKINEEELQAYRLQMDEAAT